MSEATYVIDDNGQWHDVTLTKRIAELEAENRELRAKTLFLETVAMSEDQQALLSRLTEAERLLRDASERGLRGTFAADCENRIDAFLNQKEETVLCPHCHGCGYEAGHQGLSNRKCKACGGTGEGTHD